MTMRTHADLCDEVRHLISEMSVKASLPVHEAWPRLVLALVADPTMAASVAAAMQLTAAELETVQQAQSRLG